MIGFGSDNVAMICTLIFLVHSFTRTVCSHCAGEIFYCLTLIFISAQRLSHTIFGYGV